MTDIDRRQAIQFLGATAAVTTIAPAALANAAPTPEPSPELIALRDDVQAVVDGVNADDIFGISQWRKIFRMAPGTDGHCDKCDARLEDDIEFVHVRVGNPPEHNGQRWVYRIPHEDVAIGFSIRVASDEHEAAKQKLDLLPTVVGLIKAFKEKQEVDAAAVFNAADTYDASRVGDGKPICSAAHPCDEDTWSNKGHAPLTTQSLKEALLHIRTSYVDEANLKLRVRGTRLVVPVMLMDEAYRSMEGINPRVFPDLHPEPMVWDYLVNDSNWFILTDVNGLRMSQRRAFRMRVEMDARANTVTVFGDEKRGFGCHDPRAVFGSLPSV